MTFLQETADVAMAADVGGWAIEVIDHPEDIGAAWERLERQGCSTVYQRRGFMAAWIDTFRKRYHIETALLVLRRDGQVVFILPLVVLLRRGLRIAVFPAGAHSNHNLPVFDPAAMADLPPERLRGLVRDAARALKIDVISLERQPVQWEGHCNPVVKAFGGTPCATIAQDVALDGGFEALLQRHNGAAKRKKLKAKEKILNAAGDYEVSWTREPETCRALLEIFFQQKAERLRAQGIDDPFSEPETQAFFRQLTACGVSDAPILEMAALRAGGAVRAIFGFGVQKQRVSLMVLSYSQDELLKASPGETLLFRLLEAFCARGLTHVDFGVGRERYKDSWADTDIPLVDTFHAVSARGRAYTGLKRLMKATERTIRNNPRLWSVFKAARRRFSGAPQRITAPEAGEDAQ